MRLLPILLILILCYVSAGEVAPQWVSAAQQIESTTDNAMNLAWAMIPIMFGIMIFGFLMRMLSGVGGMTSRETRSSRSSRSSTSRSGRQTILQAELARASAQRTTESQPASPVANQRRELFELDTAKITPETKPIPAQKPQNAPKPVEEKPAKSRWESLE